MKKNIMTIIIMAAAVINLLLTVVVVFSVVPAMNKSNLLVDKIASIIDLEIDSKNPETESYTTEDLEAISFPYTTKQNIPLKMTPGEDKVYYGIIESVTLSFNTKAEDYEDIKAAVETSPSYVQSIVRDVIAENTRETLNETDVKRESLKRIQEFYNSQAIVRIDMLEGFMKN